MSLYDDLGVRQGATPEEVREHYRVLVRLFHPDQFSDPVMKAAAEGQMRRFNEIAAILTDPERYRAYQAEALPPIYIQAPRAEIPPRRIPWSSLAWGAAAMACAGAIVWVSGHEAVPVPPVVEVKTVIVPSKAAEAGEQWRGVARSPALERDETLQEFSRSPARTLVSPRDTKRPEPARKSIPLEIPDPPAAVPAAKAAPETESPSSHFSGIWFYARRPGTPGKLYAPEFIETHITEHDGQVRGRYRSRYRVTDQAISPSVNFEFTGQADGTVAQMPMTRDDGARGEVHLRLISDRELELVWTAAGAASPSLTSGTAILVKGQ